MPLALRSKGNIDAGSSDAEISALLDLPLFLGYIICFFLQGILVVQAFAYYISFKKDCVVIKLAVWLVFVLDWAATIIATVAALISLVTNGQLSDLSGFVLFKALAPLCGLVTLIVQSFYCYRIYALGRRLEIPAVIFLLSITQCAMVIVAGFTSDLGVGLAEFEPVFVSTVCIIWLVSTPVADFLIAITLIVLLRRASRMLPAAKTRLERLMMVSVETGLITGCAALVELVFFLAFRNSNLHFIFFYMLPKLYSNSMMATLNARLAIPGRKFRESGEWEWATSKSATFKEKMAFPVFADMVHIQQDQLEKHRETSAISYVPLQLQQHQQRPSISSSASSVTECASTIEAFWSTYTPISKYSPAFVVSRATHRRTNASVGPLAVFDTRDPLARG